MRPSDLRVRLHFLASTGAENRSILTGQSKYNVLSKFHSLSYPHTTLHPHIKLKSYDSSGQKVCNSPKS